MPHTATSTIPDSASHHLAHISRYGASLYVCRFRLQNSKESAVGDGALYRQLPRCTDQEMWDLLSPGLIEKSALFNSQGNSYVVIGDTTEASGRSAQVRSAVS